METKQEFRIGGDCPHCGVIGVCAEMFEHHNFKECMTDENKMETKQEYGYCVECGFGIGSQGHEDCCVAKTSTDTRNGNRINMRDIDFEREESEGGGQ